MYSRIRTVEDLRTLMAHISEEEVTDENLIWFNCILNANMMSDYSLKDTAHMLLEGVQPHNTLQSLQETLNTFFEEDAAEKEKNENNLILIKHVYEFYGMYQEAQNVQDLIDELE